jgi:hypothetical protein
MQVTAEATTSCGNSDATNRLSATLQTVERLQRARLRPLRVHLTPLSVVVGGHIVICEYQWPERVYLAIDPQTLRQLADGATTPETAVYVTVSTRHVAMRFTTTRWRIPFDGSPSHEIFDLINDSASTRYHALAEAEVELSRQGGSLYAVNGELHALIPAITSR